MADYGPGAPGNSVIFRGESVTEQRVHAQHRKNIPGHDLPGDDFSLAARVTFHGVRLKASSPGKD